MTAACVSSVLMPHVSQMHRGSDGVQKRIMWDALQGVYFPWSAGETAKFCRPESYSFYTPCREGDCRDHANEDRERLRQTGT